MNPHLAAQAATTLTPRDPTTSYGLTLQLAELQRWDQVRFRRSRFTATGDFGYRGRGRVRIQAHCISLPLLLILRFYF
jgi:hypothetical protein